MRRRDLVVAALVLGVPAAGASAPQPVAVISSLSGSVVVAAPHGAGRSEAHVFDWLPSDAEIEVGAEASATLAFVSGDRYQLGPGAKARLGAAGPTRSSGPVRALEPVPPLPRIVAAPDARVGERAAAVRIRGGRIHGLYPSGGAVVLADKAVLRFAPVPNAATYRIDVEDEDGRSVLGLEVRSSTIAVPPASLLPGARYAWYVRTVGAAGPVARGEAEFRTLPQDLAAARNTMHASLAAEADGEALGLAAEVDRALGLLFEARDGFAAARARSPGDASLEKALARIEAEIAEASGGE
jgi:hypothetical protein